MLDFSPLGLAEPPFSLSPDPRFFFLSGQHKTALAKITYTTEQRQGLSVFYGDVGQHRLIGQSRCGRRANAWVIIIRGDPRQQILIDQLSGRDPAYPLRLILRRNPGQQHLIG